MLLFIQRSPLDKATIAARAERFLQLVVERPDTIDVVESVYFELFDPRTEWHDWLLTPCLLRLMELLESGRRFRTASFRRASSSAIGSTMADLTSSLIQPVASMITTLELTGAYNLPNDFFEEFTNLVDVSLSGCRIYADLHPGAVEKKPRFLPKLQRFFTKGRVPFLRSPPLPGDCAVPQFDFSLLEHLTCSEHLRDILAPLPPQGFLMLRFLEIQAEGMYRK
jgi:hypothetical protein